MRPAFVAILFLLIGAVLIGLSLRATAAKGGQTPIAARVRRRTGGIFVVVAAGLLLLDWLT